MRQPEAARAALEASIALRDANPGWDRYYLVEARGWLARALARRSGPAGRDGAP